MAAAKSNKKTKPVAKKAVEKKVTTTATVAKKATKIVTVSNFSKEDIIKQYKIEANKIDVVYNGINQRFKPINELEIK